jgi:MHS family proline/betaine transporter-like MFS transporter
MLEWYDFTVYALFASYIAHSFFSSGDPVTNKIKAYLAFGFGFVARPLGALLIGSYADRVGRKAALTLTILLMALGTGLIGFSPSYAVIGIGAPVLLLLGRVIQGFSVGGEIGSTTAFLLETADRKRRGVIVSWLEASMGMSNILGALAAFGVTSLLSGAEVQDWGWRIPFILGLIILPVGLFLRRSLEETVEFKADALRRRTGGPGLAPGERRPLLEVFTLHGRALGSGFCVAILWAVAVYVLIIFFPVYVQAADTYHFSARQAFGASLIANVAFVISCVVCGSLSDRIGRRRLLFTSASLLLLTVLPLFMVLKVIPTTGMLILVQSLFCILVASFVGVAPSGLSEIFPVAVRATGMSLVYNGAFTLFGGFAPAILTWFKAQPGGSTYAPAWYVMAAALVALCAIPLLPEARANGREREGS